LLFSIGYDWARQIQLLLTSLNTMCFFSACDAEYHELRVTRAIEGSNGNGVDNDDTSDDDDDSKEHQTPPTPALHTRSASTGTSCTTSNDAQASRRQATIHREAKILRDLFIQTGCWQPVADYPLP
jgi:hypothetical protein